VRQYKELHQFHQTVVKASYLDIEVVFGGKIRLALAMTIEPVNYYDFYKFSPIPNPFFIFFISLLPMFMKIDDRITL
jgi:hypothetical protein